MRCTLPKKLPSNEALFSTRKGVYELGNVPLMRLVKILPPGQIYLKFGEVMTPTNGYGYKHIIDRHYRDFHLKNEVWSSVNFDTITLFCEHVCVYGANIHWDRERASRLMVSNRHGAVIIEDRKMTGSRHYSVVTAIPKGKARGTLVGTLA